MRKPCIYFTETDSTTQGGTRSPELEHVIVPIQALADDKGRNPLGPFSDGEDGARGFRMIRVRGGGHGAEAGRTGGISWSWQVLWVQ